jgi:phage tail-like protein
MIVERKRPGKQSPKSSEAAPEDKGLYDWFDKVVQAKDKTPYKTGSIVIYDRTQTEVARFNLEQCWPSKLSVSDLSAGSDEVMVEELTIQHELLNWT